MVKKIKSGHFLIPQFQRDFTWKEGQTRLLIDSIARNYPIGLLVILGKNEEVPLKSRKLDAIYPSANRIIISKDSNRLLINNNPDKYLYDLILHHKNHGTLGDLDRRLRSCSIPYLSLDPKFKYKMEKEQLDTFLKDRSQMIIERIQEVMGDAWNPPLDQEDLNLEDDEFVSV